MTTKAPETPSASQKTPVLGRGLNALMPWQRPAKPLLAPTSSDDPSEPSLPLMELPLHAIQPGPFQPRQHFDPTGLEELARSIQQRGLIQPIVVRPSHKAGEYEIIAGERRFRASKQAGLSTIPALVRRDLSAQDAFVMALVENLQRADLGPLEEAEALSRLLHEFGWTHQTLGEALGRSRSSVTNTLRLLDLTPPVRDLLASHQIEPGHAKMLCSLTAEAQILWATRVLEHHWSVRALEKALLETRHSKGAPPQNKTPPKAPDPDVRRLEQRLSEQLSAKVSIQHQVSGRGKLIVQYHSVEELEGILEHIR